MARGEDDPELDEVSTHSSKGKGWLYLMEGGGRHPKGGCWKYELFWRGRGEKESPSQATP